MMASNKLSGVALLVAGMALAPLTTQASAGEHRTKVLHRFTDGDDGSFRKDA
jgi:hypothetical protein